jgi:hypothetical protein
MVPIQMDYVHIISNASMMVKFVLLPAAVFLRDVLGDHYHQDPVHPQGVSGI